MERTRKSAWLAGNFADQKLYQRFSIFDDYPVKFIMAMLFTPDSAKEFLLAKVIQQAQRDRVPLDEVERKMFLFSESAGGGVADAAGAFDEKYDAKSYEMKIAKLLRRSFALSKQSAEEKLEWKHALDALSREDFYGLVMVDQANIPRVDKSLRAFIWQMTPFALVELLVLGAGFLVVFRPSAIGLYFPDWLRLIFLPLFLALFWYVGQIFSRMSLERASKKAEPEGH